MRLQHRDVYARVLRDVLESTSDAEIEQLAKRLATSCAPRRADSRVGLTWLEIIAALGWFLNEEAEDEHPRF